MITDYGDRPIGEYAKWWGHCDSCGASVTVEAQETATLPDVEEWDSVGRIDCPVCGGNVLIGNGDPR